MTRPSDFLRETVEPAVFDALPTVFPELAWRRKGHGWQAGSEADALTHDLWAVASRRVFCKTPGWFGIASYGGVSWLEYLCGHEPRGAEFVEAVARLAGLAGIDASCLSARGLTPEQRRAQQQSHEEAAQRARERRAEFDAAAAAEDAAAIEAARGVLRNAAGAVDHPAARAYFSRRGIDIAALPGGMLPDALLFGDAGLGDLGRGTPGTAVLCAITGPDERLVGVQRLLCDEQGRPYTVEIDRRPQRKLTMGRYQGGAVRLSGWPKGCGERPLVIAEGVETAVAVLAATGWAVWAGVSAAGLRDAVVPQSWLRRHGGPVGRVMLAADLDRPDARGRAAGPFFADQALAAWRERGVPCSVVLPTAASAPGLVGGDGLPLGKAKGVDWDDVHRELGAEAVRRAFDAGAPPAGPGMDQEVDEAPEFILPPDDLERARMYLLAEHAPPEGERGGECLRVVYVDGQLYRFDGSLYVEMGGSPHGKPRGMEAMRGSIRRWSAPYFEKKRRRTNQRWSEMSEAQRAELTHYTRANLSRQAVESIVHAAADEVLVVRGDEFQERFWIAPSFGPSGTPRFDRPAWERRVLDPAAEGLPEPDALVPMRDGLFCVEPWRDRGELVVLGHTPRFFNTTRVEQDLRAEELRAVLEGGEDDLEAWAWEQAPEWKAYLEHAFGGPGRSERDIADNIRELHKCFWLSLSRDRRHKNAFIVWLHGPSDFGKSVLQGVWKAVLGPKAVLATSPSELVKDTHRASFIGRHAAFASEFELGRADDRAQISEVIKKMAGGDADGVSARRLYKDPIPEFVNRATFVIAANGMPGLPDNVGAIAARSTVFDFQNPVAKKDPDLLNRLLRPGSMRGVMALTLLGGRWLEADGGVRQPASSAAPLEDLRSQGGDMQAFVEDYIEITNEPGDEAVKELVFQAFLAHLKEIGRKYEPTDVKFWVEFYPVCIARGWRRREERDPREKGQPRRRRVVPGLRLSMAGASLLQAGGHEGGLPGVG